MDGTVSLSTSLLPLPLARGFDLDLEAEGTRVLPGHVAVGPSAQGPSGQSDTALEHSRRGGPGQGTYAHNHTHHDARPRDRERQHGGQGPRDRPGFPPASQAGYGQQQAPQRAPAPWGSGEDTGPSDYAPMPPPGYMPASRPGAYPMSLQQQQQQQQAAYASQQYQQAAAYQQAGQHMKQYEMQYTPDWVNPYQQYPYSFSGQFAGYMPYPVMPPGSDPVQEGPPPESMAPPSAQAPQTGAADPPSADEAEEEEEARAVKRPRLIWTDALHRRFLEALETIGGVDKAPPKAIMKEMGVTGLTRENVASHLQKYRMRLKRGEEVEGQGMNSPLQGSWYECALTPQAPPEAADAAQGPGEP